MFLAQPRVPPEILVPAARPRDLLDRRRDDDTLIAVLRVALLYQCELAVARAEKTEDGRGLALVAVRGLGGGRRRGGGRVAGRCRAGRVAGRCRAGVRGAARLHGLQSLGRREQCSSCTAQGEDQRRGSSHRCLDLLGLNRAVVAFVEVFFC